MKITIDVDCTPEEARAFLGLPDVRPMQDAMMREVEARMKAALDQMDPEAMMKTWLPAFAGTSGLEGFEKLQQAFWKGFTGSKDG